MLEVKVTIVAEDLTAAINNLANALNSSERSSTPTRSRKAKKEQPVAEQPDECVSQSNPTNAGSGVEVAPVAPQQSTTQDVLKSQTVPSEKTMTESKLEPVINTAPVEVNAPAPAAEKEYSLDEISRAGAALIDQGKMPDLLALLKNYGVQAVTQLDKSRYPAFVEDLRALGARI